MSSRCINFPLLFLLFQYSMNVDCLSSITQDLDILSRCNSTNPVDRFQLNKALVFNRFEDNIDENFKCFLHCLFMNYGWISRDGKFNVAVMKQQLSQTQLQPNVYLRLIRACTDIDEVNPCELTFLFTSCFWTESTKKDDGEFGNLEIPSDPDWDQT